MRIILKPIRSNRSLSIHKSGEVLTINGEVFDFSGLPDGATLPRSAIACNMLSGDVERVGGELVIPLMFPHGPNPPPAVAFPDVLIDVPDGNVELPTGDVEPAA